MRAEAMWGAVPERDRPAALSPGKRRGILPYLVQRLRTMRDAAGGRTIADLGDDQLRDIGLFRVRYASSAASTQVGFDIPDVYSIFPLGGAKPRPVGSADRASLLIHQSTFL